MGGPGGQTWYKYDHEHAYVEMIILILLVCLALVFEVVWHRAVHNAEHSYRYGDLSDLVANAHIHRIGHHGEKHLQLAKELANRTGGEFMTLGFLAFCVFVFNTCEGFDWLVTKFPSGHFHLPKTKDDWLHMVEFVHMQLF